MLPTCPPYSLSPAPLHIARRVHGAPANTHAPNDFHHHHRHHCHHTSVIHSVRRFFPTRQLQLINELPLQSYWFWDQKRKIAAFFPHPVSNLIRLLQVSRCLLPVSVAGACVFIAGVDMSTASVYESAVRVDSSAARV